MHPSFLLLLIAFIICCSMMIGTFFSILISKRTDTVDIMWAITIPTAIYAIIYKSTDASLLHTLWFTAILLWGARLALFLLWTRFLRHHTPDARYQKLTQNKPHLIAKQIGIQILCQLPITFCALPIALNQQLRPTWVILGLGIGLLGLVLETIADVQLYKFKQTSSGICNTGLWQYSRHPNYFGESLFWLGMCLCSFGTPYHWMSWVTPISIFCIMYFITGPYTEQCSLNKRGATFKAYQQSTPYFFPWKFRG
jgi:steroid 5-alpha reductase family enzyme